MLPDDHQQLRGSQALFQEVAKVNAFPGKVVILYTIYYTLYILYTILRRLTPALEKWLDEAQKKVIFLTTAAQPVNLLQQQKSMKIADNVRQQFPQPWTYDGLAHDWKIVVN